MLIAQFVMLASLVSGEEEVSIRLAGKMMRLQPAVVVHDDRIFVPLDSFARAVNREAKIVAAGRLVVLCDEVSCAPVHLTAEDQRSINDTVYVNLRPIASALKLGFSTDGSVVSLSKQAADSTKRDSLAPGMMLPDVRLINLDGEAVHLSEFIGQRILICTWASW